MVYSDRNPNNTATDRSGIADYLCGHYALLARAKVYDACDEKTFVIHRTVRISRIVTTWWGILRAELSWGTESFISIRKFFLRGVLRAHFSFSRIDGGKSRDYSILRVDGTAERWFASRHLPDWGEASSGTMADSPIQSSAKATTIRDWWERSNRLQKSLPRILPPAAALLRREKEAHLIKGSIDFHGINFYSG